MIYTTVNGTDYAYNTRTGALEVLRPSGIPCAGPVAVPVRRNSKTYAAVVAAIA